MSKIWKAAAAAMFVMAVALTGCETETPAENAAENAANAVENAVE